MTVRYLLVPIAEVPDGDDWLEPSEAAFQQSLHVPHCRSDWRLGRWAAKKALAAWLGYPIPPDRIAIHPAPDGAPEILLDGEPAPAALSFSHRAGRALCMLAPEGTVLGCDLELIEPRSEAFIQDYFTANEQARVAASPETDRPLLANLLWSAKESALKALRTGSGWTPGASRWSSEEGCWMDQTGRVSARTSSKPGRSSKAGGSGKAITC